MICKLNDRSLDEQNAIRKYIKVSHPTNVPKNIDSAEWKFYKNKRTGKLDAGI